VSAADAANSFSAELTKHRIRYHVDVVRDGAIMIALAVPGQRWEVDFHDDGAVEIERFVTSGVEACDDPLSLVLEQYE
jgi:hypothetical protein